MPARQMHPYEDYQKDMVMVSSDTRDRFHLMVLTLAGLYEEVIEQFAPTDGTVGLYLIAGHDGDPAELTATGIDPGQLLDDGWQVHVENPANAGYLLHKLLSCADRGLIDTDKMPLGEPFWGFATVQSTWTLPRPVLERYVEDLDSTTVRRKVPVRHHPDRIPEVFVSMMLHDHRLLMASMCPADDRNAAFDLGPRGAEAFAEDSDSVGYLMKAVDLAASLVRRTGGQLCPVASVLPVGDPA
jgi:hypothetical protein